MSTGDQWLAPNIIPFLRLATTNHINKHLLYSQHAVYVVYLALIFYRFSSNRNCKISVRMSRTVNQETFKVQIFDLHNTV